jgi:transposase
MRRKRDTRSPNLLPHAGGRSATFADAERERLRQLAGDNDDATLAELCQLVEKKLKKSISSSAMCRLLQGLGLPRKKNRSTPPSATRLASSMREAITRR